jgi:DNA-binding CsgD family transcriptional regulator
MTQTRYAEQTPDGQYSKLELRIMELLAHGRTRMEVSRELAISPSTVARHVQVATERTRAQSTIHAVAVLVAQGRISVRSIHQEDTAQETALNWLQVKIMSCLDWRQFQELRAAYVAMNTPATQ